jgi:hypothetical protein
LNSNGAANVFFVLDTFLTLSPPILTPNLSPPCYSLIHGSYIEAQGARIMKTYLFNAENGLYEGETFEEPDMLQYEEGVTPVPPPDYVHGQVPVFDRQKNSWTVIPITIARQLLYLRTTEESENRS